MSSVAVVGAGAVGLSCARLLRERGAEVRVYERGEPGNGQSGGESRIFRHAHDDPRLIELAQEGRQTWARWSRELGIETVSGDGVLAIGDPVPGRLELLDRFGGIHAEALEPAAARDALPLLADFDASAMLDRDGGSIRTTAVTAGLARDLGADLVRDEVISLRPLGDAGVELRSGGECRTFDAVVVAAGIATGGLAASLGIEVPVEPAAHLRATFPVREPREGVTLACFQDGSGIWGESGVYAAPEPPVDGRIERYAVGLAGTTPVSERGGLLDPEAIAGFDARVRDYVEKALPGLDPEPVEYRHCWVTALPWGEDAVSVWQRGGCLFPAGHNLFKQAPALGRVLAEAALGEGLDERFHPEQRLGAG